jgi:diguanylate cyclase
MTEEKVWREKYREAARRLVDEEGRLHRLQNVIRLLVGRLSLAARGRADRLDDELTRVTDTLRKQFDADIIEQMLAPLSQAIAVLDAEGVESTTQKGSPSGSFRAPTPATASPSGSLRAPTPEPPLAEGVRYAPTAASVAASVWDRSASTQPTQPASESGVPAAPVLDRLALLPELKSLVADLRARVNGTLSAQELVDLLDRVARLASEQRLQVQREKLELEHLVQQMSSRLDEITTHLTSEVAERDAGQNESEQFRQLVTGEVEELKDTAERAADVTELRRQITQRLDAINHHLQDFRAREDTRIKGYRDRVQNMRTRISALEKESRSLHQSLKEEQRNALIDALTGIPNRAAYDDRIEQEFKRWKRFGRPVSILAWDIDRFKSINDAYGHKAGDKVLRVIAQHFAKHVRDTDFVGRYGGEEFVMLLVGSSAAEALVVADKIRLEVAQLGFHFHDHPVTITASCGITCMVGEDEPDAVFDRADRALYKAKQAGRNCCVIG